MGQDPRTGYRNNETFAVLGDHARTQGWSHEEYLAAVLGRQVVSRTANGTTMRIAAAHFPTVKTIEDFSLPVSTTWSCRSRSLGQVPVTWKAQPSWRPTKLKKVLGGAAPGA